MQELSEDRSTRPSRWSSVADALAPALATTKRDSTGTGPCACGIGATQTTTAGSLTAALEAIEREDVVCFDVAAEHVRYSAT